MNQLYEKGQQFKVAMGKTAAILPDNEALELISMYPFWGSDIAYREGLLIRRPENKLFRIIKDHKSQENWLPENTPSLYTPVRFEDEIEVWRQSTGPHDAYQVGARVRHVLKIWINQVPNNVWEPGVYGWKEE